MSLLPFAGMFASMKMNHHHDFPAVFSDVFATVRGVSASPGLFAAVGGRGGLRYRRVGGLRPSGPPHDRGCAGTIPRVVRFDTTFVFAALPLDIEGRRRRRVGQTRIFSPSPTGGGRERLCSLDCRAPCRGPRRTSIVTNIKDEGAPLRPSGAVFDSVARLESLEGFRLRPLENGEMAPCVHQNA